MDGRRVALTFVWGASVLCALVTVVGAAFFDSLAFFGEQPSADDRRHTLMVALLVLGLCVLSLGVTAALRMPPTLLWISVFGVAFCVLLAYWAFGAMEVAAPDEFPDPWWTGLRDALLFPTTWPLQLCLVASPFVAWSGRDGSEPAAGGA